jgi:hypothetical protein
MFLRFERAALDSYQVAHLFSRLTAATIDGREARKSHLQPIVKQSYTGPGRMCQGRPL